MAGTQSFDITTGCDLQEAEKTVNQAMKEIRAVQAQLQGDWAGYGEELKKLGAILQELTKK